MKTSTKAAMLIMALFISLEAFPQWVTDTLFSGTDNTSLGTNSLFVSNQNTIHFAYLTTSDWETYNIIYMSKPCGEDWTVQESILDEGITGRLPSVTANSDNIPYIAFQKLNETGSNIAISWKLYGTWRWEDVPGGAFDNESPDIAIDGDGNVHLAWVGVTEDYWISLYYANNIGGVWNSVEIEEAILGEFGWDANPDIEVTTDGTAYIFYNGGDPGSSYQYIASNSQPGSTIWKTEQIFTGNVNDFAGGIEIYQDQVIHAVVEGDAGFAFPSTIFYTFKSINGDWSVPDTVNKTYPGTYMGMSVDNEGIVYAAYQKDEGNMLGDFYIADNSTGIFRDSLLMSSAQEIQAATMCADNEGNTHVIMEYTLDFTNYSLLAMRSGECLPTAIHAPEFDNSLMSVYPNPVSSVATISIDQPVEGYESINLYDGSGKIAKTIYEGALPEGMRQFNVDFELLPKGLYLLRLQNESGVVTRKVINY